MDFTPLTQEEIQTENQKRFGLLSEGVYDFRIIKAEETISKKGKEAGLTSPNQIVLSLQIMTLDGEGNEISRIIRDYIGHEFIDKLWNVCECLGMLDKYKSGRLLPEDFENQMGLAKIIIRKDKTGQYGDSNWVKNYEKKRQFISPPPTPEMVAEGGFSARVDDEIPF